ncbi:hypothetical protein KY343_01410 [Candidatus Woesearchaeota archaeon]|nr:hypothetical protein [Candidatus Woesearchaeota archaeon]
MDLKELVEQRTGSYIIGPITEKDEEVIVGKCLNEAGKKYFGLSRENHGSASKEAVDILEDNATVKNPKLDAHAVTYSLREVYRQRIVGDINQEELDDELEEVANHYGEDSKRLLGRVATSERILHLMLSIIDGYSESLQRFDLLEIKGDIGSCFEDYLRNYCMDHIGKIPGKYIRVEELVKGVIKNRSAVTGAEEKFAEEPEVGGFILEHGENDLLMHMMIIKYYEIKGDKEKLLDFSKKYAMKKFKNEPWFIYKYAEYVETEVDIQDASNRLLQIDSKIEQNEFRRNKNLANFFFRTAGTAKRFRDAEENYDKALKVSSDPVERDELSALKDKAEKCKKAAAEIEKITAKKYHTKGIVWKKNLPLGAEELSSGWNDIKDSLDKLVEHIDQNHAYFRQTEAELKGYGVMVLDAWRERIEDDASEIVLTDKKIEHYKERKKREKEKRESHKKRIKILAGYVAEIKHSLKPDLDKADAARKSVEEVFPGLDKGKNGNGKTK